LAAAAGLAAVALALAGCGGSQKDMSTTGSAPKSAGGAADAGAGNGTDAGGGAAKEAAPPAAQQGVAVDLRVDQRSIVYTGSISVRVDDVERKASEAVSIATAAGGFVGGDKRTSSGGHSEATLTLRIPADKFSSAVDSIARLGTQENRDINTEDVTEQVVDLDARIATQQARVASGRRLLASAKTLNDLVMLEGEVAKREADLASLQGKKARLDDLAALSTITVTLLGKDAPAPVEKNHLGFLAGLEGGWTSFLMAVAVTLTMLGALLPWAVAVGVPAVALVWWLRRRRPPAPVTPAPAPAGDTPPAA
jgi:hypothetical protein